MKENRYFQQDRPFMQAMTLAADLMVLNLMWFLCCIPVVTAGASTAALQFSCCRLERKEGTPVSDFRKAFRENFGQATILWLITLLIFAALAAEAYCTYSYIFPGRSAAAVLLVLAGIAFVNFIGFLFPLQARFRNKTGCTLANAFALSVLHIRTALLNSMVSLLPAAFALLDFRMFLRFGFIWIFFGVAAIVYASAKILRPIFDLYTDTDAAA